MIDARVLAAKYELGWLHVDELRAIASGAVCEGLESPSMIRLAGMLASDHPAELRELFATALRELGVEEMSDIDAAELLVAEAARAVVAKRVAPLDGLDTIIGAYYSVTYVLRDSKLVGDSLGIEPLMGIYWTLDELAPDDPARTELEHQVVVECEALVRR